MAYPDQSNDRPVRKTVQVFKNGRSRAIRIPKEFEFEGDQVEVTRDAKGNLILSPVSSPKSWAEVIAFIKEGPAIDFPEVEDYPPRAVGLDWEDER